MANPRYKTLAHSARPRHSSSRFVRELNVDHEITFTVFIRRLSGGSALPDLEYWQKTPVHDRHHVSTEEYSKLYGASTSDMQTASAELVKYGMTILHQHQGARTLTVKALSQHIAKAFGVKLNHYESLTPKALLHRKSKNLKPEAASETEIHIGYDGPVSVPAELADIVVQVIGLDTRSTAIPGGGTGDPANSFLQTVPNQAGLYNFPNSSASGQTIGVFNAGGSYLSSDIASYFASMPTGFTTAPTIVDVGITVGSTTYSNNPASVSSTTSIANADGNSLEVTQDILTSATIAQGCTTNVYFTDITEQGWTLFLNRILFPQGENRPNVVTISWIMFDERFFGNAISTLFQQLACVGVNVFAAVGDWGADDNDVDGQEHVGYPGSDPWVTGVGGTVVGNVQPGPPETFQEFAWSDEHNPSSNFSFVGGGTTGGGMSVVFPSPAYQTAAGITESTDSTNVVKKGGRFVPDIAGMVGYETFFFNGLGYNFIGTSCSAPLYAGLFALLGARVGKELGFLNTLLYDLRKEGFNDVTFGNNDSGDAPDSGFFQAGIGYDPVSGLGSINGKKLEEGLAYLLQKKGYGYSEQKELRK